MVDALRIIYGVSGEGSGHAIRSREVLRHLRACGHEVHVVTSGRALPLLAAEFPTTAVLGLRLDYRRNAIRYLPTVWRNMVEAREALASLRAVNGLFQQLSPAVAITDFEPLVALTAARLTVPLVSIDNIHRLVFRPAAPPWRYRHDWLVAKAVARLIVPSAERYIVTAFSPEAAGDERVRVISPILRPAVLAAEPAVGSHVVVYDSFGDEQLPEALERTAARYRVYGYKRHEQAGNLEFQPWSEERFLEDLRTCRAVVGTGGFTLISESLALKKPYLALPVRGQFEQVDNALELERLGYGAMATRPTAAAVGRFLANTAAYQARLARYVHPGNAPAMALIEAAVADLAAR